MTEHPPDPSGPRPDPSGPRPDRSEPAAILTIGGQVEHPLELGYAQLAAFSKGQVADVSSLEPSRRGTALRLDALLAAAGVRREARQLTVRSHDGFQATVPLEAVINRAVLIYALDAAPLPEPLGGPVRLLIPDAASCGEAIVDTCANVKHVSRLEVG